MSEALDCAAIVAELTDVGRSPSTVEETACVTGNAVAELTTGVDTFFLLVMASMVFLMQAGFAMLCAGSIRQKNVKNIMFKNLLDACGGALGFWSIGYAFAYGDGGGFIGASNFFLTQTSAGYDYAMFFFQFAFAATAATIVAGTVAERCKMAAYLCYSLMLTGFVYPVVVRSIWDGRGFLSAFADNPRSGSGMIDFAGSGVVHMTGGATALIAAYVLGPRKGRFHDSDGNLLDEPKQFMPHSVALQILGTFILWFGWYGFNPGSALIISDSTYAAVAALCAVTTTLSAATGCVTSCFTDTYLNFRKTGLFEYDLSMAMNGALGGLVGITAGCSTITPGVAVIVGIISGWTYLLGSRLLAKLKIDDAVDAIPVHFGCGIWGCLAVGLFAEPSRVDKAYGDGRPAGLFYGRGGGTLLGLEIGGILWIIVWVSLIMGPFFIALKHLNMFRVDPLEEEVGLDISHHKGAAYDMETAPEKHVEELIERRSFHGKKGGVAPPAQAPAASAVAEAPESSEKEESA